MESEWNQSVASGWNQRDPSPGSSSPLSRVPAFTELSKVKLERKAADLSTGMGFICPG